MWQDSALLVVTL